MLKDILFLFYRISVKWAGFPLIKFHSRYVIIHHSVPNDLFIKKLLLSPLSTHCCGSSC